jgi:hypothetical protein
MCGAHTCASAAAHRCRHPAVPCPAAAQTPPPATWRCVCARCVGHGSAERGAMLRWPLLGIAVSQVSDARILPWTGQNPTPPPMRRVEQPPAVGRRPRSETLSRVRCTISLQPLLGTKVLRQRLVTSQTDHGRTPHVRRRTCPWPDASGRGMRGNALGARWRQRGGVTCHNSCPPLMQ